MTAVIFNWQFNNVLHKDSVHFPAILPSGWFQHSLRWLSQSTSVLQELIDWNWWSNANSDLQIFGSEAWILMIFAAPLLYYICITRKTVRCIITNPGLQAIWSSSRCWDTSMIYDSPLSRVICVVDESRGRTKASNAQPQQTPREISIKNYWNRYMEKGNISGTVHFNLKTGCKSVKECTNTRSWK